MPRPPLDHDPAAAPGVDAEWEWVLHLERLAQAGILAAGLARATLDALTSIAGTCQLSLLERDPESLREGLARANAAAMSLAENLSVYRTFARGDASPRAAIRCREVVEDALRFAVPAVRAARAFVDVDVEDRLVVQGERTLVLQAVTDVVLFALRTLGEAGGRVEIAGHRDGSTASLVVTNDAPDLDDEVRARMFEPFVRDPAARGGAGAGSPPGLGLFLARRIAEEHGGALRAGVLPGGGNALTLTLPVAVEAGAPAPEAAAPRAERGAA